jgi:hypothetical protein
MITDDEIERAKRAANYSHPEPHHEHPDCIRIAYAWLDAQRKTKGVTAKTMPLKHIIEKWGGRYVSTSDVEVAAQMHPQINGSYPYLNISARLTEPSKSRLNEISEAFTQNYHKHYDPKIYSIREK